MKRKDTPAAMLVLFTQFGLSLITPLLLCVFLSLWIQRRWGVGYWVVIVGILAGLGSMALNYYHFYKRHGPISEKDDGHSFKCNQHR